MKNIYKVLFLAAATMISCKNVKNDENDVQQQQNKNPNEASVEAKFEQIPLRDFQGMMLMSGQTKVDDGGLNLNGEAVDDTNVDVVENDIYGDALIGKSDDVIKSGPGVYGVDYGEAPTVKIIKVDIYDESLKFDIYDFSDKHKEILALSSVEMVSKLWDVDNSKFIGMIGVPNDSDTWIYIPTDGLLLDKQTATKSISAQQIKRSQSVGSNRVENTRPVRSQSVKDIRNDNQRIQIVEKVDPKIDFNKPSKVEIGKTTSEKAKDGLKKFYDHIRNNNFKYATGLLSAAIILQMYSLFQWEKSYYELEKDYNDLYDTWENQVLGHLVFNEPTEVKLIGGYNHDKNQVRIIGTMVLDGAIPIIYEEE